MVVIPAIDIIDAKCVRLTRGEYDSVKVYSADPLETALRFEDAGFRFLHLVDLDGARSKRIINHAVLEKIAKGTGLQIDFGGGVQSDEDIRIAFDCGAVKVTGGSVAVKDTGLFARWIDHYGPDRIILGADVRGDDIAVGGWKETTGTHWHNFLTYYKTMGLKYVISTDVARDGMLSGPAFDLYLQMQKAFPNFNLIASGGISGIEDVAKLAKSGIYGVIVGKAIYEGNIGLGELKKLDET